MKNCLIILILLVQITTGFAQDVQYDVLGTYSSPVKKEALVEAKTMSDIYSGYPTSWITDYVSAEISATCNGKVIKAMSTNDVLSTEQKNILAIADLGTDIIIDVKYKHKNSVTNNIDLKKLHTSVSLVPEIEAEYIGGHNQMLQYLKDKVINSIPETTLKQLQLASVKFIVNEEGEIEHAQLSKTSEDQKIDNLLLEAINKMPKWKPAQGSNGLKIKQEFVFSVGNQGC